jgi:hypothetical protein
MAGRTIKNLVVENIICREAFGGKSMKNRLLILLILFWISACNFSNTQGFAPSTSPAPKPSPFITFTPSLIPTILKTSEPFDTERPCTSDDFRSSSIPPDPSHPENLIGFQLSMDWPPSDWETTIGIYDPDFDYSIQGIQHSNQHIFLLKSQFAVMARIITLFQKFVTI